MDFNTKVEQLSTSVEQGIDKLVNRLDQTDEIKSLAYSMKINVKVLAARLTHTNTERAQRQKGDQEAAGGECKAPKGRVPAATAQLRTNAHSRRET